MSDESAEIIEESELKIFLKIGDQIMMTDLLSILEVSSPLEVTHVSNTYSYFKGFCHFRDESYSVIDLRLKMGFQDDLPGKYIMMKYEDLLLCFVVDDILKIKSVDASLIESRISIDSKEDSSYFLGVFNDEKIIVSYVDFKKMFMVKDIIDFNKNFKKLSA